MDRKAAWSKNSECGWTVETWNREGLTWQASPVDWEISKNKLFTPWQPGTQQRKAWVTVFPSGRLPQ